jgi:hypothetical protein
MALRSTETVHRSLRRLHTGCWFIRDAQAERWTGADVPSSPTAEPSPAFRVPPATASARCNPVLERLRGAPGPQGQLGQPLGQAAMRAVQIDAFPGQEIDSTIEAVTESADGPRRVVFLGPRMAPVGRKASG